MERKSLTELTRNAAQLIFVAGLTALLCTPAFAKDKLPEVTSDGLHLLKDTKVAVAYVKPGATLDQYSKVNILDCFVDFKEGWQRDYNMKEIGLSGRVSDKDEEKMKQKLADEFKKVFSEVLTKKDHPVVDTIGPDVLLIRPALLNVIATAPDIRSSSFNRTYVESAGSMTLYMEFYDSATDTLLARIADPQADNPGYARQANRATNTAAVDRILRSWAELLADHLGEMKQQSTAN